MVEQGGQPVLEQREPMLHPRLPATFADRLVERVLRRIGTEHFAIAGSEPPDAVLVEQGFARREQQVAVHGTHGQLCVGVENAQAFQLVAEEIEPQPALEPAGIDIEDRSSHGEFAGVDDGVGAVVTLPLEQAGQAVMADLDARFEFAHRFANPEG